VKPVNIISSVCFPLLPGEHIDLETALSCVKESRKFNSCYINEAFHNLCLKGEGVTITVTYKGSCKIFSLMSERETERFCFDLWADFFKKNTVKQTL